MTKLLLTFTIILLLSCNQQTATSTPTSSKKTDNNLDFNVALTFINDYTSFCTPKSPATNDEDWIKNNSQLTDNFKIDFYNLLDSARKTDPELGLGFDPIFDAQDFPGQASGTFVHLLNFLTADSDALFIPPSPMPGPLCGIRKIEHHS